MVTSITSTYPFFHIVFDTSSTLDIKRDKIQKFVGFAQLIKLQFRVEEK